MATCSLDAHLIGTARADTFQASQDRLTIETRHVTSYIVAIGSIIFDKLTIRTDNSFIFDDTIRSLRNRPSPCDSEPCKPVLRLGKRKTISLRPTESDERCCLDLESGVDCGGDTRISH